MTAGNGRYKALTAAAILALVLIVASFILAQFNHSAQADITRRQQFINESIKLSQVNQVLVHAIAVAAVKNKDARLANVLAEQGITIRARQPAVPLATTPAETVTPPAQHNGKP